MPHTSHRKKAPRVKRAEVIGNDGWTRVTTTDNSQRKPQPLPAQRALEERYAQHQWEFNRPATPTEKTIEEIHTQYRTLEARWLASEPYKALKRCFELEIDEGVLLELDKCFVFGTSTFCGLRNGWIERFHVSMYQLAAFVSVINILHTIRGRRPQAFAQEPIYNRLDIDLLARLNITTIESPVGFEEITVNSFVFSPNAELDVTLRTLACNPAIAMVTSNLDIFFRNHKGEACTNAIHVSIGLDDTGDADGEEQVDEDDTATFDETKFKPLHKMTDGEREQCSRANTIQDEIEQGLGICEGFKKDKIIKKLPSLEAKDEPFYDVHLFHRRLPGTDMAAIEIDEPLVLTLISRKGFESSRRTKAGNLDFDARVPIPISVFPSTYRSDATSVETTTTKVEGRVNLGATVSSRVGREDTRFSGKEEVDITVNQFPPRRDTKEEIHVFEEKPSRIVESTKHYHTQSQRPTTHIDITKTSRTEADKYFPSQRPTTHIDITNTTRAEADKYYPSQQPATHIDITKTTRIEGDKYYPTQNTHVDIHRQRSQTSQPTEYKGVHVDIHRERHQRGSGPSEYKDVNLDVHINKGSTFTSGYKNVDVSFDRPPQVRDRALETQLDITERDYRRISNPTYDIEYERSRPVRSKTEVTVEREVIKSDKQSKNKIDMGYYDDAGQYHSFRRGVQRAVDHIVHPFSHHHHHDGGRADVVEGEGAAAAGGSSTSVRIVEPRHGASANTVTIPCHFIRVGDLLVLQGRPCQVIKISVSAQTGQYRYLGVDLFTKQLQEESSFISNPEPSVVVQSMLGPVYKQYRILDLREDGKLVCMTENGDVKQGLSVVDQGNLYGKIDRAFADGRGSVRALIINDGGRELVVDYKVIHASRL